MILQTQASSLAIYIVLAGFDGAVGHDSNASASEQAKNLTWLLIHILIVRDQRSQGSALNINHG